VKRAILEFFDNESQTKEYLSFGFGLGFFGLRVQTFAGLGGEHDANTQIYQLKWLFLRIPK